MCLLLFIFNSFSIYDLALPAASSKRLLNRLVICLTKEIPADHQTRRAPKGERKRVRLRSLNAMGRLDPLTRLGRFRVKERHQYTVVPLRVLLRLGVACTGPCPGNN
jgi:hypothetical protein